MAERVCIISYLPISRGAFGSLRRQILDARCSMIAEGLEMVNGVSGGVQRRSDLLEMMGYGAAKRILSQALKEILITWLVYRGLG